MKNMVTLILSAALFIYAINGNAAPKDSAWLSAETVMTSSIEQVSDGQPIGMVNIWATAQPIPDGWLECNGQAVNAEKYPEYVAKFGATTPDYRGFFLRGYGGKSGALGVAQDYAVQTNGSNTLNMAGIGLDTIDYVSAVSYDKPSVSTSVPNGSQALFDLSLDSGSLTTSGASKEIIVRNSGEKVSTLKMKITSSAGETRPINKAVRYIVKVR